MLTPHVDCYWTLEGLSSGVPERILPDGHGEIVFHQGTLPVTVEAGVSQPRAMWIGQMRGPVQVQSVGMLHVFGIRFRPAGAWAFTRWAQTESTDRMIALDDVFGSEGAGLAERIGNAVDWAGCVRAADRFLTARLDPVEGWVPRMVHAIRTSPEAKVSSLSWLSLRQVERLFLQQVGLGPKTFARIARFQKALRARTAYPEWTWGQVAAEAGYYDQSHFIGDFQQLAGETPRALVQESSEMRDRLVRAR